MNNDKYQEELLKIKKKEIEKAKKNYLSYEDRKIKELKRKDKIERMKREYQKSIKEIQKKESEEKENWRKECERQEEQEAQNKINNANKAFQNNSDYGFVYLIRNKDIYKIGITDNLLRRFKQLKPDEIINTVKCSNYQSLERKLHQKYKEFRIPQTEYFRLSERQIKKVNIEMTKGADF